MPPANPPAHPCRRPWAAIAVGAGIVALMLVVYVTTNPHRYNLYNHFVWQASAYLEGETSIRYPVPDAGDGTPHNEYFNDVEPVLDPDGDNVTAAKLAVDRQIEHGEVANSAFYSFGLTRRVWVVTVASPQSTFLYSTALA